MKSTSSPRGLLFRIVRGVGKAFVLLTGFVLIDHLPGFWNDISPPTDLVTIDDFREWKKDGIRGEGTYEHEGKAYTVLVGEFSAFLASGPAAYVFDSEGSFVDWTRDMGDIRTKKLGFDLTSGHVKGLKKKEP